MNLDSRAGQYIEKLSDRLGLGEHSAVLIVGLGKTGYSIARFLSSQSIHFAVTDTRDAPPFLQEFREGFPDAAVFMGGFNATAFEAATHLVVSPGVPLDHPLIQSTRARGVPVVGDLDLFAAVVDVPVLAVTGANGKSTVTTLLGLMANADGRQARAGGNLGTPMLDLIDETIEMYVLELSSFQLESSHLLEPLVATVLNISPDHMDRYPDLEAYALAKERIFHGEGVMVLNRDDSRVAAMAKPGRQVAWFGLDSAGMDYDLRLHAGEEWIFAQGQPVMPRSRVKLHGRHNIANVLASLAMGDAAGLSRAAMIDAIAEFAGLPHRTEWVAEVNGVTWINDSKATNVGACIAALNGMDRPVILIAGGDGKGADFRVLREAVGQKVKALVLLGRDAPLLKEALGDLVHTVMAVNLPKAVQTSAQLAAPGDVVMLAPACASLDQFKDYQERGRIFQEEVRKLS
jgi:UDP-N-acetylmuramoylalanine--D-glutamate ligase